MNYLEEIIKKLSGKYYTPKSVLEYIEKQKTPEPDLKILIGNPKWKL